MSSAYFATNTGKWLQKKEHNKFRPVDYKVLGYRHHFKISHNVLSSYYDVFEIELQFVNFCKKPLLILNHF